MTEDVVINCLWALLAGSAYGNALFVGLSELGTFMRARQVRTSIRIALQNFLCIAALLAWIRILLAIA